MLIEQHAIEWLESLGWPASLRVPGHSTAPEEFFTVTREGGGSVPGIARPTLLVKCWAASELRAAEMAEAVEASVRAGGPLSHSLGVYGAKCAGTSPALDPDGKRQCRQVIVNVTMAAS